MDITFPCPNCNQQLEADAALTGTSIQCPSCGSTIQIPALSVTNIHILNPISSSAAAREEHHFSVPVHDGPTEVLVRQPVVVEEVVPAGVERKLRTKTIRRIDCVEVGHDRFDEIVSAFLTKVGQENIINVSTISYTHIDIGSQKILTDFGVLIVYKG
jgi:DNA-directed RNA polymerase subunit M/transcription elongation factor TFIIS